MSRPATAVQLTTACELLIPDVEKVGGVEHRKYPESGPRFFACVKSYGGTEKVVNGLLVIVDTISLTTWYSPNIKTHCRVKLLSTGAIYEIINEPENWEMRAQFIVCKCKRVKGDG